jgi:toxin ParE1/3/4
VSPPISIKYLPQSQKDFEAIFDYIAKDNKDAALRFLGEFDTCIARLEQDPSLGQVPNNEKMQKLGYRLLDVKNYFVLYRLKENLVEIQRIIFGWVKNWQINQPGGEPLSHRDMMEHLKRYIATK